ncbi:MAG: homoserine kinase [Clostridiales bacterium]|nr:homoserine kinase [Clostridiales bacterium]
MVYVRVPATSANMGPGFDSLGIALGLYNTLKISETDSGLEIYNNSRDFIPNNDKNMVYRAICRVFDEVGYTKKGLKIVQNSDIPVTRGLGSSSACIIGGMLAANALSGRRLSYGDILDLAVSMEGHPDNVTPALFGGFCVAAEENGHTTYVSNKITGGMKIAVMVPDFYVSTKTSRVSLPEYVTLENASYNISRAALLTSILLSGKTQNLRTAVGDKLHQDIRKTNIPHYDEIIEKAYDSGACAAYLSGSGPTIAAMISDKCVNFKSRMSEFLLTLDKKWKCMVYPIDNVGAILKVI